jgi:predicted enzyme related to lactoylglutathione lyase
MNPVVHLELHTDEAPAAGAFYETLLGWRAECVRVGSASYLTLGSGGPIGAGVVGCAASRPLWLPYVAVDGLEEMTRRARTMGATVLLGPCQGAAGRRTVLGTPCGGQIALWEPDPRACGAAETR